MDANEFITTSLRFCPANSFPRQLIHDIYSRMEAEGEVPKKSSMIAIEQYCKILKQMTLPYSYGDGPCCIYYVNTRHLFETGSAFFPLDVIFIYIKNQLVACELKFTHFQSGPDLLCISKFSACVFEMWIHKVICRMSRVSDDFANIINKKAYFVSLDSPERLRFQSHLKDSYKLFFQYKEVIAYARTVLNCQPGTFYVYTAVYDPFHVRVAAINVAHEFTDYFAHYNCTPPDLLATRDSDRYNELRSSLPEEYFERYLKMRFCFVKQICKRRYMNKPRFIRQLKEWWLISIDDEGYVSALEKGVFESAVS